ncbi:hypothetical protein CLV57_1741 [Mucilaginibacter auburnensis]|uniref:DUF2946 domain-containing protein n=1 Tax=Mucilaginibacter auburnensis TaxID=1457233 RepID=A0A2H9VV67_9SPHI|nr:hypothetical protein CLV57_1741 [Mucilaginibacter auburnensis]
MLLLALKHIFAEVLKKKAKNILIAITLLLCFSTGQVIVLTHSHIAVVSKTSPSKHATTSADESCKICQISHASTPLLNIELPNAIIYGIAYKHQQTASPSYQNISLVLAATRGPPTV